jgi:hypothetical protein
MTVERCATLPTCRPKPSNDTSALAAAPDVAFGDDGAEDALVAAAAAVTAASSGCSDA